MTDVTLLRMDHRPTRAGEPKSHALLLGAEVNESEATGRRSDLRLRRVGYRSVDVGRAARLFWTDPLVISVDFDG